jgi:putative peptidoglycan lipid II flippase
VVGVLNSYDRFGAFAISPLFWNLTIILVLVVLEPAFSEQNRIYAYAIGIVIGTAVQLAIPAFDLRNTPFRPIRSFEWRNPKVRRVLLLMLPVSLSLGLINFNVVVNSIFGSLVDPNRGPAAIDKAFRIYQLPQGIFSVAIATVLFPTLARLAARGDYDDLRATMANGMRQIQLVLIPAAASMRWCSSTSKLRMIGMGSDRSEGSDSPRRPGRDGSKPAGLSRMLDVFILENCLGLTGISTSLPIGRPPHGDAGLARYQAI